MERIQLRNWKAISWASLLLFGFKKSAIRPVSRCTTFTLFTTVISSMALILAGLISIPLFDTMKHKNLPSKWASDCQNLNYFPYSPRNYFSLFSWTPDCQNLNCTWTTFLYSPAGRLIAKIWTVFSILQVGTWLPKIRTIFPCFPGGQNSFFKTNPNGLLVKYKQLRRSKINPKFPTSKILI